MISFQFKKQFKKDIFRMHIFKSGQYGWSFSTLKKCMYHSYKNKPANIINGTEKHWYKDGRRHRVNGPAILGPCEKRWFLNGLETNEKDHKKQVYRMKWYGKK